MKWLIAMMLLVWAASFGSLTFAAEKESYYRDLDCSYLHGTKEFHNSDGTWTDCLTVPASIEYDFAYKWYECLTQAMHYAMLNNNAAVCRLIVLTDLDKVHLDRARELQKFWNLPVIIQEL